MSATAAAECGAYGFRLRGLPGAERWMQPQAADAPLLHLVATRAEPDCRPSRLDSASADVALIGGGRLRARKGEAVISYALPALPSDADLLHPYLAAAAALAWQWQGGEALHAGVFGVPGGAVLLLGEKESGKSTTLAWLARHGVPVLADDLAVISDHGTVLAGPRCIDLRTGSSPGARVRNGARVRVSLPEAPSALPLAGAAVLAWGDAVTASAVPPREHLSVLTRQRSYARLPADELALLELSALPMFTLARPPDPAGVAGACEALLDCFC